MNISIPRLSLVIALCSLASCIESDLEISSTPDTEAPIREAYIYHVAVSEETGGVTYNLIEAPTGMAVSPSGVVSWTPEYADLGTHKVHLTARDNISKDRQIWDLRVHQGISMGVTVSPAGHISTTTNQQFIDHFQGHASHGRLLTVHMDWRDSVALAGQVPSSATETMVNAATYGFTPVIGFGWSDGVGAPDLTSEGDPLDNSWLNQETRDEFLSMVTTFAQQRQPPYLFLGNETNSYFVTHTQPEWDAWISEFENCYDAIKAVSANTQVYTTFNLEKMKGLGVNAGWSYPVHFDLIDDHASSGKIDAFGFTSYPYFEYLTPASIPSGYYDEISTYWTGPVSFSELGWLASAQPPYPGGLTDQEEFVARFFDLSQDLDLEQAVWLFLHDFDGQAAVPSVADIGLRTNDGGTLRPSDAAWQAAVLLRE